MASRLDGWINVLTGWGMASRDKRTAGTYGRATTLSQAELEELYRGDAMAAKVIDLLPDDMTREGFSLKAGDDPAVAKAITEAIDDIKGLAILREAMAWARLYGGSGVVMGIDDGQTPDKPLNEKAIRSVRFLTALDRWQLRIERRYSDPTMPGYGEPEMFCLQPIIGGSERMNVSIHESRVLRFDGVAVTDRQRLQNDGWGDSVLVRLFNALRGYANAHDFSLAILQDFSQGILKLRGLKEQLAKNDDATIMKRLTSIDLGRSLLRSIVLDPDDEFDRKATPTSGLDQIVLAAERRLCAEAGIPHTLLLGESPGASLGEGGRSENRDWYDHVASRQEAILRAPLTRLVRLMMLSRSGPTRGQEPAEWSLDFRPLWQMDAKAEAEIRKAQAETDTAYIGAGVLSADEVALSRFGGDTYSTETVLDMRSRTELAKASDLDDEG